MQTQREAMRETPRWLSRLKQARQAAMSALDADDLAEAEFDREQRRDRRHARRKAATDRAKTICRIMFDGGSIEDVSQAIGRKPRAILRFMSLRGLAIPTSKASVRRLATLSRGHEDQLRVIAARGGLTAAQALDLIVSIAMTEDGLLGRCILRNEAAVREAVREAFVMATYPPIAKGAEARDARD